MSIYIYTVFLTKKIKYLMSLLFVNFKRVTAGIVQGKTKIYIIHPLMPSSE
jgi:hypothetical protein